MTKYIVILAPFCKRRVIKARVESFTDGVVVLRSGVLRKSKPYHRVPRLVFNTRKEAKNWIKTLS